MENTEELARMRLEVLRPYFNWQFQLDESKKMQELSALHQLLFEQAIRQLETLLGSNFPENCLKLNHPAGDFFINQVPWTRHWFIWLAEAFRDLASAANFNAVKSKFISSRQEDFREAIILLEIAMKMKKTIFDVDFEIDIINDAGKPKKPDIRLSNPISNEKIFIEVSRLELDPLLEEYEGAFRTIRYIGFQYNKLLSYVGKIHKRLSHERWKEIRQLYIPQVAMKAATANSFIEKNIEGVFELAVAPFDDPAFLAWAEEKEYEINTVWLPDNNRLHRLNAKIRHKAEQASEDHPTILVIKMEDYMHHFIAPEVYIDALEETIHKFHSIFAVVIIGYELGDREKQVLSLGLNYCIQKKERYFWSSRSVIIFNKLNHTTRLSLHSMAQLIEGFM